MRGISLLLFGALAAFANIFAGSATKHSMDIKGEYAKTHQCIRCHLDIYEEYKSSSHFNSTPFRDKIHAKIAKMHAKANGEKEYKCAKCHAPIVKDRAIDKMDPKAFGYHEAISCAYCHRIERIAKHAKANRNIISPKKGLYYGTRNPKIRSEYHKIDNSNIIHKNGDTCLGCHSHKQNDHGFVVCRTESNNTLKQNCITCHMPQIEGSLSDRVETPTHAYHGFAGVSRGAKMLNQYLTIDLKSTHPLTLTLHNKAPHAFLLHPLRMAKLIVIVSRNGKEIKRFEKSFVRVIGKNGKPTPPWVANRVIKDTMLKANEKRDIDFGIALQKGDKVKVIFGIYKVQPKMAKKMGLPNEMRVFKEKEFDV